MKSSCVLIVLMLSFLANSQTYRFIYDVEYKKDSASDLTTKENYLLDISKNGVLYYNRDFFIADSLINHNIPFPNDTKLSTSTIISHKTGSIDYNEYDLLENTILKLQTKDSQNWKLIDEKKRIKNLTLQKATTNWGGRNWTAWFTTEIPFQDGPYKFHGLPGLIAEIYDDKGNYKFELARSQKYNTMTENQFTEMFRKMAVAVTWERYKMTKIKFYESPVNFIRNGIGELKNDEFFLNDGTKVNANNMREVNEILKRNIRNYNNPIELSKAISYPET